MQLPPMRGFDSEILKEPHVYRTYEAITHYGEAIKMLINEQVWCVILSLVTVALASQRFTDWLREPCARVTKRSDSFLHLRRAYSVGMASCQRSTSILTWAPQLVCNLAFPFPCPVVGPCHAYLLHITHGCDVCNGSRSRTHIYPYMCTVGEPLVCTAMAAGKQGEKRVVITFNGKFLPFIEQKAEVCPLKFRRSRQPAPQQLTPPYPFRSPWPPFLSLPSRQNRTS